AGFRTTSGVQCCVQQRLQLRNLRAKQRYHLQKRVVNIEALLVARNQKSLLNREENSALQRQGELAPFGIGYNYQ
ncbi:hypothetical protein OSTOST_23194, partial [Ostertagia ostertagi]